MAIGHIIVFPTSLSWPYHTYPLDSLALKCQAISLRWRPWRQPLIDGKCPLQSGASGSTATGVAGEVTDPQLLRTHAHRTSECRATRTLKQALAST